MMKPEDVRRDYAMMSVVRLVDGILRDGGLDLGLVAFNVLPTSENAGLIEFVDEVGTVGGYTATGIVLQLLQSGHGPTVLDRFTRSLAGFWIISWLFGVCDRHKENVLLRKDGIIVQVDFGYILGQMPPQQIGAPAVPITTSLLSVTTDPGFTPYRELLPEYCWSAYRLLRPHYSMFATVLGSLQMCDPPVFPDSRLSGSRWIYELLRERWRPGIGDEAAKRFVHAELDACIQSSINVVDVTHKASEHTKNAVTSVTSIFGGMFVSATGAGGAGGAED